MKQRDSHSKKSDKIKLISYHEKYKKDFVELNLVWIKKYFKVESQDLKMLNDVEDFLAKGACCEARESDCNLYGGSKKRTRMGNL